MPLVPLLLGAGLLGAGGFITGSATSDKLGTGISLASMVVGLFLVFILTKQFKLI